MKAWYRVFGTGPAVLFSTAVPGAAQDGTVPMMHVPSPGPASPADERLARQVSNLLNLIVQPDPRYETFALLSPDVRLMLVGQDTTRIVQGPDVREALKTIFRSPDDDHWTVAGSPDVRLEGRYGRFTVVIGSRERGRSVGGCIALHGDAVLNKDTWSVINLVTTQTRCGER